MKYRMSVLVALSLFALACGQEEPNRENSEMWNKGSSDQRLEEPQSSRILGEYAEIRDEVNPRAVSWPFLALHREKIFVRQECLFSDGYRINPTNVFSYSITFTADNEFELKETVGLTTHDKNGTACGRTVGTGKIKLIDLGNDAYEFRFSENDVLIGEFKRVKNYQN